jgi:chemotaxis family two-component system response regulator Rcp1
MSDFSAVKGVPTPIPATPERRKQIEVLVVEASPADTRLTEEAFKAAGLTSGFRSVTDGEDALSYVRREGKYADVPIPDLIFLDLSLPKISGLEVLRAIKSTPSLMHIPIVVASGTDDPEEIRAVYALNGNAFMRKPADLVQFLRFIEMCYEFWGNVVTLSPPPKQSQTDVLSGLNAVSPMTLICRR